MSNIPLPERGQPLDVTYIYQMATAINDLASISTKTANKTITVKGTTADKVQLSPDQTRMLAQFEQIQVTSVTLGQEYPFTIKYAFEFKNPPIVVATPVNINNTAAGKNVTVVLSDITTSSAQGTVKFNSSGDLAIGVNVFIIGQLN
jgi:hypothetical protein